MLSQAGMVFVRGWGALILLPLLRSLGMTDQEIWDKIFEGVDEPIVAYSAESEP